MANELNLHYPTGQTITAVVWFDGTVWDSNAADMVATSTITDVNWPSYVAVTMTEVDTSDGTGTGMYVGSLPATGESGVHHVDYHDTATPAPGRLRIGYQDVDNRADPLTTKTGMILAATGLDTIPVTEPSGVATDFREMVIQTWMRWYREHVMTSAALITKDTDGTSITTQTATDISGTKTLGKAADV